jgi:hypothetical protein
MSESDSNQRHTVRVPKMLEVEYSADCPPIQTRMQDLSETGLFLESHFPLAIGTVIDLRFELPDGNPEPIVSRGRVCNVDPMGRAGGRVRRHAARRATAPSDVRGVDLLRHGRLTGAATSATTQIEPARA